jgi:hypothetical protein
MEKALLATLLTIGITILSFFASFLVPVPQGNNPFDFYFNLTVSLATTVLYIGGSIVIMLGFSSFTNQFRRAYSIMFTGLTFWAIGYLQLPLMVIFDVIDNNIVISLTVIPFIASALLVFTGTRMLAKLFGVISLATKWWFALSFIFVIGVITALAPHVPITDDELGFDIANVLIMIAITFFGFGAYHILLIKRRASVTFTNAFAWLCLSMATLSIFAGAGSTFTTLIAGYDGGQLILFVALIPSCIAAALFLRSAYSFNQIAESGDIQGQTVKRNFFGNPVNQPNTTERISSIDIVTHATTLVSTREAISDMLNTLQYITSQLPLNPPLPLPAATEQALRQVYLQIEQYLLTKESIRKFTKESIRHEIAQKLGLSPTSSVTFWNTLA